MFASEIYGPKQIRLTDIPEPSLNGGPKAGEDAQIIFQPQLGCLCGSDMVFFENDYPDFPPKIGHSLHEIIGRVVKTNGSLHREGDRVLCVPVNQQGFFERFAVSEKMAMPIAENVPIEHALMAQPLGTVMLAMMRIPPVIGLDVAIVGQGPIGLLFDSAVRNMGARRVIAIDKLDNRLDTARQMGANEFVNVSKCDPVEAVREITQGAMVDIAIEVVGHREQAIDLCIDLLRRDGHLLQFGLIDSTLGAVNLSKLFYNRLTYHTTIGPTFDLHFPLAMQWISEGRIDVSPLITHRFDHTDVQAAFDMFFGRRDNSIKVLLDFPAAR